MLVKENPDRKKNNNNNNNVCDVSMAYFYFLKGRKSVILLTVFQIVIKFSIYSDNSCAHLTGQDII